MGKGDARVTQRTRAKSLFRRTERRLVVWLGGSDTASGRWLVHGGATSGQSGEFSPGRILRGTTRRLGSDRAHGRHGNGRRICRGPLSKLGTRFVLCRRRGAAGSFVSNLQRLAD